MDRVVVIDVIAIGERRVHGSRRRVRADAEVDRGRRIPHEHFRLVSGGPAIVRRILREAGQSRRLLPHRLRESSVDLDGCVESRNLDASLTFASDVDGTGGREER